MRTVDGERLRVFLGLDVGKGAHHAVDLDPAGKRLHDKPLPNSEPELREVFDKLAKHGRVLVVVDQPNTIGALPVTVARACGLDVAYLPGLAMRGIVDLYPGTAKTDARDNTLAELDVLIGYDDDLAAEATRISNRIRGLPTGLHPALERVLGPRVAHPAMLEILSCCGGQSASAPPGGAGSPPSPLRTPHGWGPHWCRHHGRPR